MMSKFKSIRPFIGSKNFAISREFYLHIGFEETELSEKMSVFSSENISFYLQDAYVKDWVDNTMIFVELEDIDAFYKELFALDVSQKFQHVRLSKIKHEEWGSECFLHDPSGILWHFGKFK